MDTSETNKLQKKNWKSDENWPSGGKNKKKSILDAILEFAAIFEHFFKILKA
jgi:hypothetical protein